MKIAPTLEGGLRVDAEIADDWILLEAIVDDAMGRKDRLADRLGKLVTDESLTEDWREFVVPDLDADFQSDIASVALAVEKARGQSGKLRATSESQETAAQFGTAFSTKPVSRWKIDTSSAPAMMWTPVPSTIWPVQGISAPNSTAPCNRSCSIMSWSDFNEQASPRGVGKTGCSPS